MSISERIADVRECLAQLSATVEQLQRESIDGCESSASSSADVLSPLLAYLSLAGRGDRALLDTILRCAMHVTGAGGAGLTVYRPDRQRLVFVAAVGDGAEGILDYEVPLEGSQHGLAFATGEVQASTPLHRNIEASAKAAFRNVLVAPLLVDGEPIGTLSAVNKEGADAFTPQDMEAYQRFSELAAIVVRQWLREEVVQRSFQESPGSQPEELAALGLSTTVVRALSLGQRFVRAAQRRPQVMDLIEQLLDLADPA